MRPRPRATAVVTAALLAMVVLLVAQLPGHGATDSSPDDDAFSDIAGCISTSDNVLVSLVVDESLSLRDTDPDDLRVQGITTAIDSLQALSESLGDDTRVHVSLSTFARDFETVVGVASAQLGERRCAA